MLGSKAAVHLMEEVWIGCTIVRHKFAVDTHLEFRWCSHQDLGCEDECRARHIVGGVPWRLVLLTLVLDGDALQDESLIDPHL